VNGTSSATTFSLLVLIGGRKGVALVDSGSTHTFMDYSFATNTSCVITSAPSQSVTVAGGGKLNSAAIISSAEYSIQNESFVGYSKLLQLQGYNIIFGCDWIQQHIPITIDLRQKCKYLTIQKKWAEH
jgi:hypothetical protein